MSHFNKILFLFIFLVTSQLSAQQLADTTTIQKQNEAFRKYLNLSRDEQFQLSERKLFAQKALDIAQHSKNHNFLMEAYSSEGYIDAQQGHYADAFNTFSMIEKMSDSVGYNKSSDWRRKAYLANVMGLLYKELGEYDKALEHYYQSLTIADSVHWTEGSSVALNNISILYNIQGNTKQAISILKDSWKLVKDKNQNNVLFDISINLLDMYTQLENFDSALYYGAKAKEIANEGNSPYNKAFVQLGFGKLYIAQHQYRKAKASLNKATELSEKNGFNEIHLESLLEIARAERLSANLKSAKAALNMAEKLDNKLNIPSLHIKYLMQLSKYSEASNNYKSAYKYYTQAIHLRDSINKNWERVKYSEIEALNQIKLEKQKNEVLKQNLSLKQLQLKHQRLILYISVVSLLILLWLFAILYRKRKFEQKTNKMLREKNEKISAQEKIIRLKNEENLKKELDYKNRQLTSNSLSAVKQAESLDIVFSELRELLNQHAIKPATRKKLEEVIQHLKPHNSEKEWEEFRSYFEEVHPSFYSNLKKRAPYLTLNEQKVCAYIRLGMSTKEIAAITFRQIRSVESTRFRIRKKLGLTANENLFDFLNNQ